MKKEKIIVMHLILDKCKNEKINYIVDKLKQQLIKYDKNLSIQLGTVRKYWKYPDENLECFISIYSDKDITICKFIDLLEGKWDYTEGYYTRENDTSNNSYWDEDAVWSSLEDENSIFIDKIVRWVHVYNWTDRIVACGLE